MPRCDSVETNLLLFEIHLRLEFGRLLLMFTFIAFLKNFESIQLSNGNLPQATMKIFEFCLF